MADRGDRARTMKGWLSRRALTRTAGPGSRSRASFLPDAGNPEPGCQSGAHHHSRWGRRSPRRTAWLRAEDRCRLAHRQRACHAPGRKTTICRAARPVAVASRSSGRMAPRSEAWVRCHGADPTGPRSADRTALRSGVPACCHNRACRRAGTAGSAAPTCGPRSDRGCETDRTSGRGPECRRGTLAQRGLGG